MEENNQDELEVTEQKWYQKTWFIVLMLIFLAPVGLIMMWVQNKFSKPVRISLTAILGFFILVTAFGDSTPQPTNTENTNTTAVVSEVDQNKNKEAEEKAEREAEDKAKKEAEEKAKIEAAELKKKEAAEKAEHKKLIIGFEKSIYDLEKSAKPIMDKYQKVMKGLGKTTSIFDAYSAANNAKEVSKRLKGEFYSLDVPDGLPDDIKDMLKEVTTDLGTAYYSKEEAYDYAMQFFDEQKPSLLQQYKDEMASSDQYVLSGAAKLFEAKSKLGIDVTKETKK